MVHSAGANYTERLRSLMQAAGIESFRALSRQAAVSEWQVRQLRRGKADQLRGESLCRLSEVLQTSLHNLLSQFSLLSPAPEKAISEASPELVQQLEVLKLEYQRLQDQLTQQREVLWREFQQESLNALESWLIQYPTAVYSAQQNPQVPATRLLPLMRPVETLIKNWQVEAIATVGAEIPFDPQSHQLIDGNAETGDRVRVRYVGYRQGDRLLHRAKVSPCKA